VTTVRDLALLAKRLIQDHPDFYGYYKEREFTYNKITQPNRNRLLWMDGTVDGIKTGHTSSAGYCLVASAQRGPRRLISVVVGTDSDTIRAQESLKLLNFGFQFFDTVQLYAAGQTLSQFRIWKGKAKEVPVGFTSDFVMSLPKGQAEKISATLTSQQPLVAPVQKGQPVGTMQLTLDGRILGEYPVVALQDVPLAGFFGRLWDALLMWIKNL
jgi:D-alanyl-D-alanine carboxypeptidase (penicillin-binding protein 5/6)